MAEIFNNDYIQQNREVIIENICSFIAYDFLDVYKDNVNIKNQNDSIAIQAVIINNFILLRKSLNKCKNKLNHNDFRDYLNIKNNGYNILEWALLINKNLNIQISQCVDNELRNKLINDEYNSEKIIIDILLNYYNLYDDNDKLFKITSHGNINIIKYTLDHIKNLEIRDSENNNLLHASAKSNNLHIVKNVLKKFDNKRNIILQVNNFNQNVMDIAVINKNYEIVKFLTKYIYSNLEKDDCPICRNNQQMITLSCYHTHKVCVCCYQFMNSCPLCRQNIVKNNNF
jgi:hypothetical protein